MNGDDSMFLAWNEIKYSKTRFALIVGVMFLVSYLVFFLTGLAYGLAQDNRLVVDKWDAAGIVLSSEANNNLSASTISRDDVKDIKAKETAELGQLAGVITKKGTSEKININVFGVNQDEFINPNVTEGRTFEKEGEVVVDDSLKIKGLKLGDKIRLSTNGATLKIVGFTTNSKFNTAPIVYMDMAEWQAAKFGTTDASANQRISGVVVKSGNMKDLGLDKDKVSGITSKTFISNIPGYTAQTLTFSIMIGFLFVIAAFVIGIFIYVLTLQKSSMFGVMKAQGIATSYIAKSIVAQTFLLATLGVGIGLVLTIGTALVLPEAVPYMTNYLFLAGFTVVLISVAILGALFSVRTIVKIDPLEAIGG